MLLINIYIIILKLGIKGHGFCSEFYFLVQLNPIKLHLAIERYNITITKSSCMSSFGKVLLNFEVMQIYTESCYMFHFDAIDS